jgi:hypothetical protein
MNKKHFEELKIEKEELDALKSQIALELPSALIIYFRL